MRKAKSQRKIVVCLALVLFLSFVSAFSSVEATTIHTTDAIYTIFKGFCSQHPDEASWESLGKSVAGQDILIFKFGNPNGGRVLWDARIHGDEDIGTECFRLFANWLLNSGEQKAKDYLKTNYILFIPAVNVDRVNRMNYRRHYTVEETAGTSYQGSPLDILYGVNLNRNFPLGFGGSGSSNINSTSDFRGIKGGSEPETQALIHAFETFKPRIYFNTHQFGGPLVYCATARNTTLALQISDRQQWYFNQGSIIGYTSQDKSTQENLTPYPFTESGAGGYAIYDASRRMVGGKNVVEVAMLIEYDPRAGYSWENRGGELKQCPLWAMENYYYQKQLSLMKATLDVTAIALPVDDNQSVTYNLLVKTGVGGTTNPSTGTYSYQQGSTAQVSATPYANFTFLNWKLDGSNVTSNPITVTMNANHDLTPIFKSTGSPPDDDEEKPPPNGFWPIDLGTMPVETKLALFASVCGAGYVLVTNKKRLRKLALR